LGTLSAEDNIVWGTVGEGDNIVWGTFAAADNIVWGTDCGGANCFDVVWGTSIIGFADNIVWGTAEFADNIVWGTSGEVGNVVWATSSADDGGAPAFDDPNAPPAAAEPTPFEELFPPELAPEPSGITGGL
jgi:hypothetical protein